MRYVAKGMATAKVMCVCHGASVRHLIARLIREFKRVERGKNIDSAAPWVDGVCKALTELSPPLPLLH